MRQSQRKNEIEQSIKIIPIGGLDAIGRNMTAIETEKTIIIVDCGIMFPTPDTPGIDYIIPDFTYFEKNREKVAALFITHGHEDHIGAVPFFLKQFDVPVFATKLTIGFIKNRLEERPTGHQNRLTEVSPGELISVKDFQVEFIPVNHSIVDGCALAIKTPIGIILHSGDFKFDHTPEDGRRAGIDRLAFYGQQGVLFLMSDSTNAERPGYTGSEMVLNSKLFDIFSSAKGRIIVATFASNISRIQQVLNVAQKFNKKVVISGRSMQKNIEIAKSIGYLDYKENLIVDLKEAKSIPEKRLVIICTGTQGEPMSALTRIANGTHKHFTGVTGDRIIITASVIPGNERTINTVINQLMKQNAQVYYEQDEDIHVSGHGSQEELKLMLALIRPKFFMPIHGEFKHLKAHTRLAMDMDVRESNIVLAENGDVIRLSRKSIVKESHFSIKSVFVEGGITGDITGDLIKDRQTMSTDGIVIVSVVLQEKQLLCDPEVIIKGIAQDEKSGLKDELTGQVMYRLDQMLSSRPSKNEIISALRKTLKNTISHQTSSSPLVEIFVQEV